MMAVFQKYFYQKKKGIKELFATKKISLTDFYKEPFTKKYLENEIRFLSELNHPNIVKLFEVKRKCNYIYLIMEYCNGGTLLNSLEKYKEKKQKTFYRRNCSIFNETNIISRRLSS